MKLQNPRAVADHIVGWLRSFSRPMIGGLSGGIDSALVAALCTYGDIPSAFANMPCHSTEAHMERARAFARDHDVTLITVDVTAAADGILAQVDGQTPDIAREPKARRNDIAGLFSCSRAPVLDYLAKRMDGIIVGTGNRDEDGLLRYFAKRGDGAVDISPLADLHKSEVRELFAWVAGQIAIDAGRGAALFPSAQAILYAEPSADLWGGEAQTDEGELGFTYTDVEWADKFIARMYGESFWALEKMKRIPHFAMWVTSAACTEAQGMILAQVSDMELATQHKANPNIPVCMVHNHPEWFADE